MNKLLIIGFSITFFLNNFVFGMSKPETQVIMPSAEEIQKIMETDEFKEMMGELEKIFGDIDEDDFNSPSKKIEPKPQKIAKKVIPKVNKSQQQHFEEAVKSETDPNKIVEKLLPEKREAFYFYINKLTTLLNDIQRKINGYSLGIVFKEQIEDSGLNNLLNEIDISVNQIKSKKLYMKAFFLPMFTELRKKIISVLPKLEKILSKINKYSKNNDEEILNIEYLKKIAIRQTDETSNEIYLKLNPLQKEIILFFEQDLKEIEKQITTIAVNSLVKEAIVKKIDIRKQLEKNAAQKAASNRYSRIGQYPRTGGYSYPRSANRTSGYNSGGWKGRKYPSSNRTGGWYNDYYKKQRGQNDSLKTSDKNSSPSTKNNSNKSRAIQSKKKSKKTDKTINKIKSMANETILLLNEFEKKYNLNGNNYEFKQIYNSKLLSKINLNLNKLKEESQYLNIEQQKTITEISSLRAALTKFIPSAVRLAKNFGPKEEIDAAFSILSEANIDRQSKNNVESEFARYEEELINQISKKQNEITSFESKTDDLKHILNNLKILETEPQVNVVKIEKTKEALRGKIKTVLEPWNNVAGNSLEQIDELRLGIGKDTLPLPILRADMQHRENDQSLKTKPQILAIINQTNFPDQLKQTLNKSLKQIEGDNELTQNQQTNLQKDLSKIAIKLKKDAKLFAEIMKITEPEVQPGEDAREQVKGVEEEGILGKTIGFIKGLFEPGQE